MYQQIIRDVLRGCEGVINIVDDLVIHGKGIEQHDERLFVVLNKLVKGGGFDIEWGQINVSPRDIFWPSSDTEWGRN